MTIGTFGFQMPKFGNSDDMFTLAQKLIASTEQYADDLLGIRFSPPVIEPNFPTLANAPAINELPPPSLIDVTWTVPSEPGAFNGTLSIQNLLPGPFTGEQPTLNFPAPPTNFTGAIPAPPSLDLNFTYPTFDDYIAPTVPSLYTLDTVVFNPLNIPTFNVTVPALNIVQPQIIPYKEGPGWTSTLLSRVDDDLLNALNEGTWTGLPGPIEANLWDRERERAYRTMDDAISSLEDMESLGYAFPPGAYLNARVKLQTDFGAQMIGVSRDIAANQAQLTLTNINKARELAIDLEKTQIEYTSQMNQRALESAKYITEASVALYNASIEAYSAQLKGYEVQAQVYDTQLKGIQAQIAQLQAQIQFEETKAEINTQLVNQYRAEVDASLAIIQIYDLEVKIIQTKADIQKTIIEAYGAQIQAFVGEVNAYSAQVEAYKATAETQGVIENVYKTQVDAYASEVQAGVAEADALVKQYEGQVQAYTAQLEGYKAAVQAMIGQAQATSFYNEAAARVFEAEATAQSAYNQTLTAQWQAVINEQLQVTQIGVSAAEANGKLYVETAGIAAEAAKVAAQVNAQLGAAALGAIHWATTANYSESEQNSFQISQSDITESITSS